MGAFTHIPVMARECMDLLFQGPGKTMVDGTLGLGGHSGMILSRLPEDGRLIGIDQDLNAIAMAGERLPKDDRITLVHESFFHIPRVLDSLGVDRVDGILLDLGVSSYQLDDPTRGFSYMADGPLDMRMDSTQKISAWDVVNGYSEKELDRVIYTYGEERWSRRIAQFIVERRPIDTSFQLVEAHQSGHSERSPPGRPSSRQTHVSSHSHRGQRRAFRPAGRHPGRCPALRRRRRTLRHHLPFPGGSDRKAGISVPGPALHLSSRGHSMYLRPHPAV